MHWKEPLKNLERNRRSSGKNAPGLIERDLTNREDITHAVREGHPNTARRVEDMTKESAHLRKVEADLKVC